MNFLEKYAKNEVVQGVAVLAALCLLAVLIGQSTGKRAAERDFTADTDPTSGLAKTSFWDKLLKIL